MSNCENHHSSNRLSELLKCGKKHIHFVGVLGISMSSLAEYLSLTGHRVSGSDRAYDGKPSRLSAFGVELIREGETRLASLCDILIYSNAIREESPELLVARKRGIPIYRRSELLAAISEGYKNVIGVSGTHGKSTTTALLCHIFTEAGLDPTVFSGAVLGEGEVAHRFGGREFFIYEGCEYKNSFLDISPNTLAILNIEYDHTDFFKNEAELRSSFATAAAMADRVVINTDCDGCRAIIPRIENPLTVGRANADYVYGITEEGKDYTVLSLLGREYRTSLIGDGNVYDAITACAVALEYGIKENCLSSALLSFKPPKRRLEYMGKVGGVSIFYDYAHHPSEISCNIRAIRSRYGACSVIFRPHTYTRTRDLWRGFVDSLRLADRVLLLDIFPAREEPIEGVSSDALSLSIGDMCSVGRGERELQSFVASARGAVILMGAGDVENELMLLYKEIEKNDG